MPTLFETVTCVYPDCHLIPPTTQRGGLSAAEAPGNATVTWNTTNLIFRTQCGAEFINLGNNITYTLNPIVSLACEPVSATIL